MSNDSPLDRGEAVNLASHIVGKLDTGSYKTVTDKGVKCLADAVLVMDRELSRLYALQSEIAQTNAAAQGEVVTRPCSTPSSAPTASAAPSDDKSETPRTDAMVSGNSDPSVDEYEDLAAFTRQLERELNGAITGIMRLRAARSATGGTKFWPIGYVKRGGLIEFEPGREPGNIEPGKLIYIVRNSDSGRTE